MSKKRCDVSVFEDALDLSLHLFLLCCLVLSSCVLPFTAQAQEDSPRPVISREVDLVVLPVTVKNRNGRFVSGLTAKNFQVYEDGKLQEIALFRQEDIPVTVGLVVDHSSSMTAKNPEVLSGALAFVRASNPQDLEFVVNFSDTVSFDLPAGAAFTSSMLALQAGITARIDSGRTALYDALTAALLHIQNAPLEKKVLLLISDGGDNNSQQQFSQVLHMAQTTSVSIYAIGLFDSHSADQNPRILKKLASDTGGQAYLPHSSAEVVKVCQQIAEDIRHQYTIGYSPNDRERNGYRKLRISVVASGQGKMSARTRAGYLLPQRD
jgi:Ca-activated chloride channel family protein